MKKIKAAILSVPTGVESNAVGIEGTTRTRVTAFDRWLARRMLRVMGGPPIKLVLWNAEELAGSQEAPVASVWIRDHKAFYKLLLHPDLHFGDLYSTGHIDVEGNLVKFLETVYQATRNTSQAGVLKPLMRILNRTHRNTFAGSKDNIHHHYDISNDFYGHWLDEEMQYTCAYFPDPGMTLEQAQIAKMDHVCRKLRLKPGDRVVEAGCGWGGLARHMARHYGAHVKAYNISHEQLTYARERAKTEGLADRVEYIEDDYRNVSGKYDVFVSVGMLEHVGVDHYAELGEVIHRSITANGRGLIHTIGRNKPGRLNAWIEKRIFPGGQPPSLREIMDIFEPREFSVLDVENLRLHYAKTLEHWLDRFERHIDQVAGTFDLDFIRAWRLYLSGSTAAFNVGSMQLFQVTFARPMDNTIPWNRAHLYAEAH